MATDWIEPAIKAGAALWGASRSSSGARDAAATAAAGSQAELDLIRESRDLARSDQEPYRLAGYEALDALRSMTGLGGPRGGGRALAPANRFSGGGGPGPGGRGGRDTGGRGGGLGGPRQDIGGYDGPISAYGGRENNYDGQYGLPFSPTGLLSSAFSAVTGIPNFWTESKKRGEKDDEEGLNEGGFMGGKVYNVHETAPENIYSNGSYTRGKGPVTIDGKTGYVEPNSRNYGGYIEGRDEGGFLGGAYDPGQYGRYDYPKQGRQGVVNPTPTGIPSPTDTSTAPPNALGGFPRENPGGVEGGYNFMTDPGYAFRFGEGIRALDRSAAASGGLLSGGYGRKLTRYGQDYASNEYGDVYNRISNIAGLGQVATNQSGQYALNAGAGMGTAAAQAGLATAYGQQGASNAWANAANEIGKIDWGNVFNRNQEQP